MQYQALRKEASSGLLLLAAIGMILVILSVGVTTGIMAADSTQTSVAANSFSNVNLAAILILVLVIVMLPVLGVSSLPIIGLFLIRANARSDRPLKTTGYTLLRGFMITGIVAEAFLLAILAVSLAVFRRVSLSDILSFFSLLVSLLMAIASVRVLKAAKEVVIYGCTYRKFPNLLPVSMMISLCISALTLLLTVLANTVPALTETLADFRVATAARFYSRLASSALSLATNFLFLLLAFRGKKALTQQEGFPPVPY